MIASQRSRARVGFIDEVRGFAIICMVFYHAMYDLVAIFDFSIPFFYTTWFSGVRTLFVCAFVFISGTACRYSRNNLRRGALCFGAGMLITYATALFMPDQLVQFGILHMLGVSMILFGLAEKIMDAIPPTSGIFLFLALYALTYNVQRGYFGIAEYSVALPNFLYDANLLFPLGFLPTEFVSADYFPLFPWLFMFLAGSCFGVLLKANRVPRWFYVTHLSPLAFVGRHTIWIYLFHQPIVLAILWLIF